MNTNNSKSGRMSGGWAKLTVTAAVLVGTALSSGCDKSMESMARKLGLGSAAFSGNDGIWGGAIEKRILETEPGKVSALERRIDVVPVVASHSVDSAEPCMAPQYQLDTSGKAFE